MSDTEMDEKIKIWRWCDDDCYFLWDGKRMYYHSTFKWGPEWIRFLEDSLWTPEKLSDSADAEVMTSGEHGAHEAFTSWLEWKREQEAVRSAVWDGESNGTNTWRNNMKAIKPDDGRPAFPGDVFYSPDHGLSGALLSSTDAGAGGMTLRDYFAAKAMAGIIADGGYWDNGPSACDDMASDAYRVADAMLKARKQ